MSAAFDAAALERLRQFGGDALVAQIVEIFRGQAPTKLAAARAALAAGDGEGVRQAAHALKSSAGQLGAVAMQALCETIEHDARDGRLSGLAARVELLAQAFDDADAWLTTQGFAAA